MVYVEIRPALCGAVLQTQSSKNQTISDLLKDGNFSHSLCSWNDLKIHFFIKKLNDHRQLRFKNMTCSMEYQKLWLLFIIYNKNYSLGNLNYPAFNDSNRV